MSRTTFDKPKKLLKTENFQVHETSCRQKLHVRPANDQTQYCLSYLIRQIQGLGLWPVLSSKETLLPSQVLIAYIFTDMVSGKW